jgi:N-methylhydantoinase B
MHLGALPDAMQAVIGKYGNDIAPGDVYVLNDPDEGGMHLPDVFMIKPVFAHEVLVGYATCVAHHQEIGGRVAGGNAVDSTEIYQEGLQIPLLKLYDCGRLNETLLAIWLRNMRIPDVVYGDVQAQEAACHVGEEGLLQLALRHTPNGLQTLMDQLLDYTEARVQSEIAEMPRGRFEFEHHIDDDGIDSGPINIRVALDIGEATIDVDFAGTSSQVKSALNATMSFTKSAVYTALRCVMSSDIPSNDGFYRPITVHAPEGTILNPIRPAPRAARGLTGYRTVDATLGALASAVPDRVPAAGEGGASMIAMGGTYRDGRSYVFVDFPTGGWGARPDRDGVDGTSPMAANAANVPIEEIELNQPAQVERYGFLADTGGPGKWRGCLSVVRELRFLETDGILQIRSDRRRFQPYGLDGGLPGSPSNNILNPGANQRVLPTKITMPIEFGDAVRHVLAGGGGHGDPLERDPQLVLADYLDEKVTAAHALEAYGVVIDQLRGNVNYKATQKTRTSRLSSKSRGHQRDARERHRVRQPIATASSHVNMQTDSIDST